MNFNLELDLQLSDKSLNPILTTNAFPLEHQQGEAERTLGTGGRSFLIGSEPAEELGFVQESPHQMCPEELLEKFSWRSIKPLSIELCRCLKPSAATSHRLSGSSARSQTDRRTDGRADGRSTAAARVNVISQIGI